jgi:hypothetical protein
MIRRYNLKQQLLLPLHLFVGIVVTWLFWSLFHDVIGLGFDRFEPQLPNSIYAMKETIGGAFATLLVLAAMWEAWRMWRSGISELPGILEEVFPWSNLGPGAGSGRWDMAGWSVEVRVLVHIGLFGPLQIFAAWQRLQNWIPDTPENRSRIEHWKAFAESQERWHSELLYRSDEDALDWLIRMHFLDYSPTKGLVRVRTP